jgi:hypothetical protein
VEGQHHIAALEVLLAVEVGRIGADPSAALWDSDVPDVVT